MTDPGSEPVSGPDAVHVPVLLAEVLHWLDPQPGQVIVDGTVGAGGHAAQILHKLQPGGRLIGLDRDPMMLTHAESALQGTHCQLVHASYAELGRVLKELEIEAVDGVLVDLGLSSDQLAHTGRGFGFDSAGLDMRFDTSAGQSATELLNESTANELADIFYEFGEERFARRIARRIVEHRPIASATQLADIVRRAAPGGHGRQRIHPAEGLLHRELPAALRPGGRAVVISFHSLEDRLVKRAFRDGPWDVLTRKPITAGEDETQQNPRSRSAKLRAAKWLGAEAGIPERREETRVRGNWRQS